MLLKRPLRSQRRQAIPAMVLINEVIAYFPFCSHAQFKVVANAFNAVKINPELWFGKENGYILSVCKTAIAPEIGKSIKGEQAIAEVHIPCSG